MKKILAILMSAIMLLGLLAGCGAKAPEATEGTNAPVNPVAAGMLVLNVNGAVNVSYDADGLVMNLEGADINGEVLVGEYVDYLGKSASEVICDLITSSKMAGFMLPEVNYVVVKQAVGSALPGATFLETIEKDAEAAIAAAELTAELIMLTEDNLDEDGYINLESAKGILLAALTYVITAGGTKGVAAIFSKLVPFMSLIYILMGLAMIVVNITEVPAAIGIIIKGAFTGHAAVGGFAGAAVSRMIQTGMARSVYSNEAGWGTSPMVHSSANTRHPVEQGLWGSFEVFFDTFVVCSITALSVILSGMWTDGTTGGALALGAFGSNFGFIGSAMLAIIMVIFTVTTSGGWFAYYLAILEHMNMKESAFSKALMKVFYATRALPGVLWTIYLVKTGNTGFIWTVVDITSAIPTFVNVFVVLILSGDYFMLLKDYKARYMNQGQVDEKTKLFYEE